MAAPNLIGATAIIGKTSGTNLSSTNATTVLNNPAGSGRCLKINTLNVANTTNSVVNVTIGWYDAASVGGTQYKIVGSVPVPGNSTLNVIDKSSQYYLEENNSIGATASVADTVTVTCSYEDIS
jgi:hypothetical protein